MCAPIRARMMPTGRTISATWMCTTGLGASWRLYIDVRSDEQREGDGAQMRALVTTQLTPWAQERLERDYGWSLALERGALFGPAYGQPLPRDLHQYDAAIVEADPIGPQILEAMPRLCLLACVRGEPV